MSNRQITGYRLPRAAKVRRVSNPGDDEIVYVVMAVGVYTSDAPSSFTKPVRAMTIRRDINDSRWRLVVNGELEGWYTKLRHARTEASKLDDDYTLAMARHAAKLC